MLNLVSILIGLIAVPFALVGVIPFPLVPMLNWVAFPIALFGAVIGMLSGSNTGRNLNFLVLLVSGVRLFLTGGLI
ncbi:hypothetical protein FHS95_001508 [Sphingomonas naasensis]|uniref:Uncharacterized protein n=1 Tax=Sphingomonas naasensis TaxID=1344951 RepID=A0A4S1WAT5_9SPHN|nr:hypothetical protein [Sphingomonas naasensis]NIJ19839.1 hypothetical protein [Sphingomonas naasensis]TGX40031.1 hypothetical protein E5A74_15770 [Sphingomonas naasensis]